MVLIKNLKDLSKDDFAISGSKGAYLGELAKAGFLVPPGFVITAKAFEKFLKNNNLNSKINSLLYSVNKEEKNSIENASEKIQALILKTEIPPALKTEIYKYFKMLKSKYIAIRSSATVEDLRQASWAGQLDTFLNTSEKNLFENIKKCWASLFNHRAIFYKIEKGFDDKKISIAVIVQKMIKSEISGVIFSLNPVNQNKNQIIIESGIGLGEAIVSGKITPNSYIIEKNDWRILDRNIIQNKKNQKLSDREIIKLAKIAFKVEKHFGFSVDIEWAKEKNKFYIIQSRPITTIHQKSQKSNNILEYIKSQKWFLGVRPEESLFFYSANTHGYDYIKKEYGINFAETLLVPIKKNYPIRVFNLLQAEKFHLISNQKILKNPDILSSYIKKDNDLYQKIVLKNKKLISAIENDDYASSCKLFNEIISLYEITNAYFIIIFSLGMKLAENINSFKKQDIKNIIKNHNRWRNNIALKEETLGENLIQFFKYILSKKRLNINPLFLMKFLTINEIRNWLKNELTDAEIEKKIKKRRRHRFVYLNLRADSQEIIDDPKVIKKIQKYFSKLNKESKISKNVKELIGQTVDSSKKIVKGRVIIIKNKYELKNKSPRINGHILVTTQTTPHFIPYIKNAKAIITDEGGITCHAAILAREFNISCIVGTKNATQVLKDNNFIELNPNNGVIKIKKK